MAKNQEISFVKQLMFTKNLYLREIFVIFYIRKQTKYVTK